MNLLLILSFLGIITGLTILWLTGEKVVEYAYTRAAEVCLSNGFEYFKIEKTYVKITHMLR